MKKLPKQIHVAYILNKLYINGTYANLENYYQLQQVITNGTKYTILKIDNNKINVIY